MIQLPTGSGKSLIGAELLRVVGEQMPGVPHAWLTHRQELRRQSSSVLINNGLIPISMADMKPRDRRWFRGAGGVNVLSPQQRKWPEFRTDTGLLVIDEAHHTPAATWARLAENWLDRGGLLVGLTATPWRMSRFQGFTDWYEHLVTGPSIAKLQRQGYLATPRVIMPHGAVVDDTNAETLGSSGDYTASWMEQEIIMMLAQKPVAAFWRMKTKRLKDKRTLWFLPTTYSAHELARLFPDSRVLTAESDGLTRRMTLDDFAKGKITHLVSVDLLSEGVDTPTVPIIASLRPTRSLAVFLQQCGRGSRPKHDKGGKYLLIDYAGNTDRHGMPDDDREWHLEPRDEWEGSESGDAPTASCYSKTCADIRLHPSNRACRFCGKAQYFICPECKILRRWTTFTPSGSMCSHCAKSFVEVQRGLHATDLTKAYNTPMIRRK